jgi:hypothetical protein
LKETGRLSLMKKFIEPKAYSKMRPRPELLATSVWALEQAGAEVKPAPAKD